MDVLAFFIILRMEMHGLCMTRLISHTNYVCIQYAYCRHHGLLNNVFNLSQTLREKKKKEKKKKKKKKRKENLIVVTEEKCDSLGQK